MNMKTTFTSQKPNQTGSALVLTLIMSAVALALLAGGDVMVGQQHPIDVPFHPI